MPKEFSRQVRVADQIQRSLAQLIQTDISDPRVGLVNINSVDVARDYSNAKIFITFVDVDEVGINNDDTDGQQDNSPKEDDKYEKGIEVLNHAAGYLRGLLAKTLNSRTTPRLIFILDRTSLRGQALSHLIDKAVASDHHHNDS